MLIADAIDDLAKKFMTENASDQDIQALKALAKLVHDLESKPSPLLSFLAGWRHGRDLTNAGKDPYRLHDEWMDRITEDPFCGPEPAGMCHKDDVEPANFAIPVSPEIAQGFGSLGHIDLFDPDTGAKMESVPVTDGPKLQTQAFNPGRTADMVLLDRVAKLENEVVRMRRDMGERIRDLSAGTTFEGRIR